MWHACKVKQKNLKKVSVNRTLGVKGLFFWSFVKYFKAWKTLFDQNKVRLLAGKICEFCGLHPAGGMHAEQYGIYKNENKYLSEMNTEAS